VLELDAVTVKLGRRPVVSDLSARVAAGEWLALIGPNGAGKTTAIRAAAGLVSYSGSLRAAGREVADMSRRDVARAVALVPQLPITPSGLTVTEYVLLGRTPHVPYFGRGSRSDLLIAARALQRLDLQELADRPLDSLSGGERQRAVLARALVQEAPILLLDEPTTALDVGRQQAVLELVDCLRHDLGLTVISAMHDLTLAAQYADRLLLIGGGRAVAEGAPRDVLRPWRISEHFRANVEVIPGTSPAVVPRRPASVGEAVEWAR
jgi:iron complex transport system ATP-binding protein